MQPHQDPAAIVDDKPRGASNFRAGVSLRVTVVTAHSSSVLSLAALGLEQQPASAQHDRAVEHAAVDRDGGALRGAGDIGHAPGPCQFVGAAAKPTWMAASCFGWSFAPNPSPLHPGHARQRIVQIGG